MRFNGWLVCKLYYCLFLAPPAACKLAVSESRPGLLLSHLPQPLGVLTQTNTPQGAKSIGRLACC